MDEEKPEVCERRKVTKCKLFQRSLAYFIGIAIGVYVVSAALGWLFSAPSFYFYLLSGLGVSSLATYYKLRMMLDPDYQTGCGCNPDDVFAGVLRVLSHKKSTLVLGVPNTVFGMIYYLSLILLNAYGVLILPGALVTGLTRALVLVSCIGSIYLWYVMIKEVHSVCIICSSIHATSVLMYLFY